MSGNTNQTIMQFFEWYLPNDGFLWRRVAAKAEALAAAGITGVWLPPAYKGTSQADVGYGVYDLYDLGEFDQKGTVRTKYGTKEEYTEAVRALQAAGIKVIVDIVLNQKMGADGTEKVQAIEVDPNNRNVDIGGEETIEAWTKFVFPGRNGKYSDFTWNWNHFSGTDWDESRKHKGIYRFAGKNWNKETDPENGNYDYLMGADLDTDNPEVREEIRRWIRWYHREIGFDGVRLDAVKHISFEMYRDVLREVRAQAGNQKLFAVGEYWSPDIGRLKHYLDVVQDEMMLFDVPLHYSFCSASNGGGGYGMQHLLSGSLISERPDSAVTFVDNHDTEPGQALESFVQPWFKPLAYAVILLRAEGLPCVFYGDYYGIPSRGIGPTAGLGRMLRIRQLYAYGPEINYFDDENIVGFVRLGDKDHPDSGIAVLMSDAGGGVKRMQMGRSFAGQTFHDAMRVCADAVTVDDEGWAVFETGGGNVSVWVTRKAYEKLEIEC